MEKKRFLLDCTLRDGGYVNDWKFDTATARGVIDCLYEAGFRNIEVGIMGKKAEAGRQTMFTNFTEIEPLLENRKTDCRYFIMLNQAEANYYDISMRSEKTVDCIRLAYFKKEFKPAMEYARMLLDRGYQVFLQAMATFMYTDEELLEMIDAVNELRPTAFYMVDSFGTMLNGDVREMTEFVGSRLREDVLFGFHAHNNIQMAFSNTIEFLKSSPRRELITDCSIYGMGRGAGNVPTELLITHLNEEYAEDFKLVPLLRAFDQYIKPIFEEYFWGYSLKYFLTSSKKLNSAYGWFVGTKGIDELEKLNDIFDKIPEEIRYTLSVPSVNAAIEAYEQGNGEKR